MASTTVAPPTPAAAAPAVSPAPAAAPTPAPAATPAPVGNSPKEGQSLTSFFSDALKEAAAPEAPAAAEPAKEPEVAPAAEPGKETAAADVDPTKPADAPAAEPAKPAVELDMGETIAPSKLSEVFKAAPEAVQQWINDPANADVKNALYAMARRDEKARPILDMIPDVKTAENLVGTFDRFHGFDDGFNKIQSTDDAYKFFQKMYEDFALPGEGGKKSANPAFAHLERAITKSNMDYLINVATQSGQVHPLLGGMVDKVLDVYKKQAEAKSDGDVLAAIDVLRGANPAGSPQPQGEPTPDQKKRDAELRAREDAANARDREAHETKAKSFYETARQSAAESAVDQFMPLLEKANLSEFEVQKAVEEISNRLQAQVKKNPLYVREYNRLKEAIDKQPSEANQQALQEHIISYQNIGLGKIVSETIRDVTEGRVRRTGDKSEKIAGQIDKSKAEPVGVGSHPAGPQQMSEADWEAQDKKEWEKSDKRVPFLTFTMDRALKRAMQS